MSENVKAVFFIFLIIGVIALACIIDAGQGSRVDNWAKENGYVILEKESCLFETGPFWYRGKNCKIFKLRLEKNDVRRTAYARVGISLEVEFYDK